MFILAKALLTFAAGVTFHCVSSNKLLEAIMAGDTTLVRNLLDTGAKANEEIEELPLLIRAIQTKNEDIIEMLIESGSNAHDDGAKHENLLLWAVRKKLKRTVALLLRKGANPNGRTDDQQTSLHVVLHPEENENEDVDGSREEMFKMLVMDGEADVNALDVNDSTPTHRAAICGKMNAMKLLAKKDAEMDVVDKRGYTPFMLALKFGKEDIAKFLWNRGVRTDVRDQRQWNVLHYAVHSGCTEMVEKIINSGIDIDSKTSSGDVPLIMALVRDYQKIAEILIEADADVNASDGMLNTPLHWAARCRMEHIAEMLLERGSDPNASTDSRMRPLHLAAMQGSERITNALLAAKAKVNVCDYPRLDTPTHYAAANSEAVLRILLDHGGRLDMKNVWDISPLERAAQYGSDLAVRMLIEAGSDIPVYFSAVILNKFWPSDLLENVSETVFEDFDDYVLQFTNKHLNNPPELADITDVKILAKAYNDFAIFALYRVLKSTYYKHQAMKETVEDEKNIPSTLNGDLVSKTRVFYMNLFPTITIHGKYDPKLKKQSVLETKKIVIFDATLSKLICGRTYLKTLPLNVISDAMYSIPTYNFIWKLEKWSWNLAMAAHKLNPDASLPELSTEEFLKLS